jgi:hypothetical protein
MKEIKEFVSWAKGESEDKTHFVLLKTQNCPKCQKLINKEEAIFGDLGDFTAFHVFTPTNKEEASIVSGLNVSSVPVLICRYKDNAKVGLEVIIPDVEDDFINLQCILDAINGNDSSFFGYNQYDEPIEDSPQYGLNRIRHMLNGEVDPEVLKERSLLKKEVR